MGKELAELSLFAKDKILYIKNPKDSTKKLLELINEFFFIVSIFLLRVPVCIHYDDVLLCVLDHIYNSCLKVVV